ncbi:MAG: hypothetical protein ACFFCW_25395 [Candidatus Hodarchaeota archaeon]
MAFFLTRFPFMERIFYRIEGLFKPPIKLPPDSERSEVKLPPEGETISVEIALNSRCTSDYDGNPRKFHWGIFDPTRKLSDNQIKKIIRLARIPRFTDKKVEIQPDHTMLTFMVDKHVSGIIRDWMMVESGMQQQAVGLVCAALGVGMVFRNLGKDGTPISDTELGTVRFKLDAMKPTYDGSFWSSFSPAGGKPWVKGNLPDPIRDGETPLIVALSGLKVENKGSKKATEQPVSQLLWAARGRTPHLYKSTPWGMTIPAWGGQQDISSVYFISHNKLWKYINWNNNRPTHSLLELDKVDNNLINKVTKSFFSFDRFIVLGKNEGFGRAFWEVGYQLLNLLLQAQALEIPYEAALLDESHKSVLSGIGIDDPVAIFAI